MMRHGLTLKLSLLLACIGVIASGATGFYAYHANRTMLVHEAEQNLLTSTELLGQRLSVALGDVAADAKVLAALPSSARVAQSDDGSGTNDARERLARVFASFMANHPDYLQIRLITRQHYGRELIRFDRNAQNAVRVEASGLQEKGQFAYVFDTLALPPRGVYVAPITVNHEHGAHSAEGKPTLRLATPVITADGSVTGVVVIDVDLASLLKVLQVDLPPDYQVYLANQWGDFLIHPDAAQTFGFDRGRRILMQDSFPATVPLFEQSKSDVLMNGLVRPQQAAGHVLAFIRRPFGVADGNRFIVLGLARPLSNVLAGATLLGERIVRMVLVSSVLAFLLAILFARALTQPLHMLAHAATHFFADHTMGALPLRRTDEIGVLARCFDRMRREIRSQLDVLHNKQHELVHLASHDALTGLPNRMMFADRLEAAIHEAAAAGERLAVLFVDLDRFKRINDTYGHLVGDQVLMALGRLFNDRFRLEDLRGRWGGEEFVLAFPDESAETAARVLSRVLDEFRVMPFRPDPGRDRIDAGAERFFVTFSAGLASFPADGLDVDALIRAADRRLYGAKRGGRAQVIADETVAS
jgi:diguanylate cyclase (GGDEF)-like protein